MSNVRHRKLPMQQPLVHQSLASIPEGDLVKRLLSVPHWRERLLKIYGIPDDSVPHREVLLNSLGKEGDIDILLVSASRPDFTTAIQVKRIKVDARTFISGKPNRLSALSELHRQSNLLVELGFAQVFSYAIVVVDSRAQNNGEYSFEGLTNELRSMIDSVVSTTGLHTDAGFIQFEIAQPIDDVPLGTGTFSGRIHRMATPRSQSVRITEWAGNLVAKVDA